MIILRANDILPDPRVEKYIEFFNKIKISYKIIGWNREKKYKEKKNTIYFNLESNHGDGSKNIKKLIKWNYFLLKKLIKERKTYKIIHACDFDTVLPALILKLYGKKVIFDIFDWYSDSRNFNNKILKFLINSLENLAVRISDSVIICDEKRKYQIKNYKKYYNKINILPNIPNIENIKLKKEEKINKIIISYVGILSEERGIIELLNIVSKKENLYLKIAGFGNLEKQVEEYAKKYQNIEFYGKVEYEKGINLMYNSDLIYAMYYKTNKNHIYAAPNKYYEALYLKKPIITTKGTLVGDKTLIEKTGVVIDEGEYFLSKFFDQEFNKEVIKGYEINCEKIWSLKYKYYIKNFLENNYLKKIGEKI